MNDNVYIFTGRVIPERALISVGEIGFLVGSTSGDIPEGKLYVEILLSQISARYICSEEVKNIYSLRNLVEDSVRSILDVAGYYHGYAYDAEIIQAIRPFNSEKHVFGIDIPALKGIVEAAGISTQDIFDALTKCHGNFLRHALQDVREAIKSPKDTGFFCYRAIESLKNCCVARMNISDDSEAWSLFREMYSVDKDDIMRIKSFADSTRHGNYLKTIPMSDEDRAGIFTNTWEIINKFITREKNSPPFVKTNFLREEKGSPSV